MMTIIPNNAFNVLHLYTFNGYIRTVCFKDTSFVFLLTVLFLSRLRLVPWLLFFSIFRPCILFE